MRYHHVKVGNWYRIMHGRRLVCSCMDLLVILRTLRDLNERLTRA